MKMMNLKSLLLLGAFTLTVLAPHLSLAAGEAIYRAKYTPFGETLSESGNLAGGVDYTFTGQELDPALAMLDYGARFYNPRLGRFTGVDPIDPRGESPYAYANNNPLRYIDPSGGQGIESSILNLGSFVQNLSETAQSALRGWAQVHFANMPQLNIEPNARDIQTYHTVAAVGLFYAAILSAVEYELSASDPSGSLSGSMSTSGKVALKASSPYGSASINLGPDAVSAKASLKGKIGPLEDSMDTDGNASVGANWGDNQVKVKLKNGIPTGAEVKAGKTIVGVSEKEASLVVQGTGLSVSKTGRTTVSVDAGGLGVSATVDPQRTKELVNRALDHMNQAWQTQRFGPEGPAPNR